MSSHANFHRGRGQMSYNHRYSMQLYVTCMTPRLYVWFDVINDSETGGVNCSAAKSCFIYTEEGQWAEPSNKVKR